MANPKRSSQRTAMDDRIIDDDDLSRHLLITNSVLIRITEKRQTKRSAKLGFWGSLRKKTSVTDTTERAALDVKAHFNDFDMQAAPEPEIDENKEEGVTHYTHHLTLACNISVFPNLRDTLKFQVTHREAKMEPLSLTYKEIADAFEALQAKKAKEEQVETHVKGDTGILRSLDKLKLPSTPTDITFTQSSNTVEVTLRVAAGSIGHTDPNELDPRFIEPAVAFITSIDSSMVKAKELKSMLAYRPAVNGAVELVEHVADSLAGFHPLAKVVLTALSIPYKLMKNESIFNENLKGLIAAMLTTCDCLTDARYYAKITAAKETFASIMKTLRDAALFVDIYLGKHRLGQVIDAQFLRKLEDFAECLIAKKNEFVMAIIVQIARDVDRTMSMTSDQFLRVRLKPAEGLPLEDSCLKDTRVKILSDVYRWVHDREAKEDILWIFGPPGAGKSTIATTLVRELAQNAPYCVKFFCKRDEKLLRDPRQIWRALAYELAAKHDGLKTALMQILDKNKGDPQDHLVEDQFKMCIESPLETDMKDTRFRMNTSPYPVIIIDALDECSSSDIDDWNSLLRCFALWAKISGHGVLKLIVTSRDLPDIRETLGDVSYTIGLTTGEDVLDESKADVKKFFTAKFEDMRPRNSRRISKLPSNWPSDKIISELTNYAAGLFVWADMVVKYVGAKAAGADPVKRLADVVNDISTQGGKAGASDGRNKVDRLYARILLEAFRCSDLDEKNYAKRCLAAIVLAKEPLGKDDILELLSDFSNYVDSTLEALSPIISAPDVGGKIRVCHKTVPDFLLSRERSEAAMKFVVEQWNGQMPNEKVTDPLDSFILDCAEERKHLALACFTQIQRCVSKNAQNVGEPAKRSSVAFDYAIRFWSEHLEDIFPTQTEANLKSTVSAIHLARECLQLYVDKLALAEKEVMGLTNTLMDVASFALTSHRINTKDENALKTFQRDLQLYATKVDIARGNFQVGVVVNLAQDVDKSAAQGIDSADDFLRKRLRPSDQRVLDEKCLPGTRTTVLEEARIWLNSKEGNDFNLLWISGSPGAGKSTIATSLIEEFKVSESNLCAEVVVKRDFADRRDPRSVWRTLTYGIACMQHAGLKGSIMEALMKAEDSYPRENAGEDVLQIHELLVRALQQQQDLSVVFVIDALDECHVEDNEQWRALFQTLAGWVSLPQSFKLVVTSRDTGIPSIRNNLGKVSKNICLTIGIETRRDIETFFRTKLSVVGSVQLGKEPGVIESLTEKAAGSFIWAELIVELVKKHNIVSVSHLDGILNGDVSVEGVDALFSKMLLKTSSGLRREEWETIRLILTTIVLAKDPLRKCDLVELVAQRNFSVDGTNILVDRTINELNSIISVDSNQVLRIPHKSFCDFLLDDYRSQAALTRAVEQRNRHVTDDPAVIDPRSIIVNIAEENRHLAVVCMRLIRLGVAKHANGVSVLLNQPRGAFDYARRFWVEHLENIFSTQVKSSLKSTLDAIILARKYLQRYVDKLAMVEREVIGLTDILMDLADFALTSHHINNNNSRAFEKFISGLKQHVSKVDIMRGNLQIQMVMNLASDINILETNTPSVFLQKRLQPSNQTLLDEKCLEGTRVSVLRETRTWLNSGGAGMSKLLWIVGAPGAGKSALATTLAEDRKASQKHLFAKVAVRHDVMDRRDPSAIWRTLAYDLACSKHAGLQGSIMMALLETTHSQSSECAIKDVLQIHKLLVQALREQQYLSVVFIVDALDECFVVDDERWKAILQTFASSSNSPRSFKLVVTSRDIPEIRHAFETASYPIHLTTKMETQTSMETRHDIEKFLRTKLQELRSVELDEEATRRLALRASGSFLWAKLFVELVKTNGTASRGFIDGILNEKDNEGDIDALYGELLLETLGGLRDQELQVSRSALAAIVLAKDPLRKSNLVELLQRSPYASDGHQLVKNQVDKLVMKLSAVISVDSDQLLRIPHKSFSDFLFDRVRGRTAMTQAYQRRNRGRMPTEKYLDSHAFPLDYGEESESLVLACLRLIHHTLGEDSIVELLKDADGIFAYACRYWFSHFEDVWWVTEPRVMIKKLADAMHLAFRCMDSAHQKVFPTDEAETLIRCLRDATGVASQCIEISLNAGGRHKFGDDAPLRSLERHVNDISIASSNFVKAMPG